MTTIKPTPVRQPTTGQTSAEPVRPTSEVARLSSAQPDLSTTAPSATAQPESRRPDARIEAALQQWRLKGGHTVPAALRRENMLLMQAVHLGLVHDVEELPDALFTDRANVLILASHFGTSTLDRVANGFTDMKLVERALAQDPALALDASVLKWRAPTDTDIKRALQSRSDLADHVPAAARARQAVALAIVTADPGLLSSLPTRTREDPTVVAAAVRGDPALFDGKDVAAFRQHPQVVEALLLAAPSRWTDIDPVLLARPDIARAACVSVRTKSEGLPRDLFAGRAASSSAAAAVAWTWILEA